MGEKIQRPIERARHVEHSEVRVGDTPDVTCAGLLSVAVGRVRLDLAPGRGALSDIRSIPATPHGPPMRLLCQDGGTTTARARASATAGVTAGVTAGKHTWKVMFRTVRFVIDSSHMLPMEMPWPVPM